MSDRPSDPYHAQAQAQANTIKSMFNELVGHLKYFHGAIQENHPVMAMLAHALAEAWVLDDHALDIDTSEAHAELSGDLRLRALGMLESHYGKTRDRVSIQRDLQRASTSLSGNIFRNQVANTDSEIDDDASLHDSDPTFALLNTAVSEYLEQPNEDHLLEILACVVGSLNRSHAASGSTSVELLPFEIKAVEIAAAWAAQIDHPSNLPGAPEKDAVTFLAAITAAAAVRSGLSPDTPATRISHAWSKFSQIIAQYHTPTSAYITNLQPSDSSVAGWMMVYRFMMTQMVDMVRIAELFDADPTVLVASVEDLVKNQIGRELAPRRKVQ